MWDVALIASVAALVVIMAALRDPRRKALVLTLPIPFTVATLAVAAPIDVSHVLALSLLLGYTVGVWFLHRRCRLPLALAVATMAGAFVAAATLLAGVLPRTPAAFWAALLATFAVATLLRMRLPQSDEVAQRRDLPLSLKVPAVVAVVSALVLLKGSMGGFMTLFPMVGLLASFENRAGLYANVRQIPVVMLTMLPLMATAFLLEPRLGLGTALLVGWLPFLAVVAPFLVRGWRGAGTAGTAFEIVPAPTVARQEAP
jgi:hypothetical protein